MMAATTLGCECPTLRQPTPPERSRKVFPSTSVSSAPSARCTTAGRWMPIALATYCCFSASNAFDFGPGIWWVTAGDLANERSSLSVHYVCLVYVVFCVHVVYLPK